MPRNQWRLSLGVLSVLALCVGCASRAAGPSPSQAQDQATEPTSLLPPPQQQAPWEAAVDDALSQAVARLFREGMADPRGLEYREVSLLPGSSTWGRVKPIATRGWVLPPGAGSTQRFAIAWSGLVYPVSEVGALASVEADVDFLLGGRRVAASSSRGFGGGWDESHAVDAGSMLPLKAALLMRLGEDDRARRVWSACVPPSSKERPLAILGSDYFWARFDRALGAHARGDDRLALSDLRAIDAGQPLQQEVSGPPDPHHYYNPSSLDFLAQAPTLLADQEQRQRQRCLAPASTSKIARMVHDLEDVQARQSGQPGGVALGGDARVRALLGAGDEAVPPLLDALESDSRLTRSIQFERDFQRQREVIAVADAAFLILNAIFKASGGSFSRPDGERVPRASTVAAMRAYWSTVSQLKPHERPFRLLLDDTATPQQWLEAAQEITRPRNAAPAGSRASTSSVPRVDISLVGEPLRGCRGLSVVEVLRARALKVSARALKSGVNDKHDEQMRIANGLALALARWDVGASAPFLREQARRTEQYAAALPLPRRYSARDVVAEAHLQFWRALNRARDGATRQSYDATYAAWLVRQPFGAVDARHFKPLWTRASEARWRIVAQRMFGSPRAPWGRLLQERSAPGGSKDLQAMLLLSSPMLKLPAFQSAVERGLRDRVRAGTCLFHAEGYAAVKGDSGWSSSHPIPEAERALYAAGAQTTFRACDLIASNLFEPVRGEPRPLCQEYWSQARRDAGVARALRLLRAGALYAFPNPFWAGSG